jgi:hypothetical protein
MDSKAWGFETQVVEEKGSMGEMMTYYFQVLFEKSILSQT